MTTATEVTIALDASSSDLEPFQIQDIQVRLSRTRFPDAYDPEPGDTLTVAFTDGEEWSGCYVTLTDDLTITLGLA